MPENRETERARPPSPEEYRRLREEAEELRQSRESEQSDKAVRASEIRGGMHAYIRYTGIGIQFVLVVLLGVGGGYGLDQLLGTEPWLLVAGAVVGSVGAMVFVVLTVLRMERRNKEKNQDEPQEKQ
jgi:F0F1-type ATP synthase assembly protein I